MQSALAQNIARITYPALLRTLKVFRAQVYSVNADNFGVQQICSEVSLGGETPVGLHGGAMLGVALQKTSRSGVTVLHVSCCSQSVMDPPCFGASIVLNSARLSHFCCTLVNG